MRPGTRRNIVQRLNDLGGSASKLAQEIESAELPDLRTVSVGWGGSNGCEIMIGRTYVFRKGRDERHIVDIIRGLAWGLFESARDSGDPSDPKRLAEVQAILREVGETIPPRGPYIKPCPKCGGLRHICIACDGECKVDLNSTDHKRETTLCPECSLWLAPQEPR